MPILILFLGIQFPQAQHTYRTGLLPQFNLNIKLKSGWKINSKIEARQRLKEGIWGKGSEWMFDYERTDISGVGSKKIGAQASLAGGYMLRIQGSTYIHRFIQQYSWVSHFSGFRLGHRISSDQTFSPNEAGQYRFRYRLSYNAALNGERIDPSEFYAKISNEYLNIFKGDQYDLEIRLSPMLGFAFSDDNKLEWGLDYRADAFIQEGSRHSFWWVLGWYLSI